MGEEKPEKALKLKKKPVAKKAVKASSAGASSVKKNLQKKTIKVAPKRWLKRLVLRLQNLQRNLPLLRRLKNLQRNKLFLQRKPSLNKILASKRLFLYIICILTECPSLL